MENYYLYIVLTRTNTTISKLIQFSKKDEYTHAAISLDKELKFMYSFGRKYTYNPFMGRFKQENINEGAYKFSKVLPGLIIELEVSEAQYEKARSLLEQFIIQSKLYKYNYIGLLYSLSNKESYSDNRFLCSEFVYYILNKSGIIDFSIARNLVRPQNLSNLDGKIIYRGDLRFAEFLNRKYKFQEKEPVKRISKFY